MTLPTQNNSSDYSRVEDYISEIDAQLEYEYGAPWDEMDNETKEQALLDHFFKRDPTKRDSARQLRQGLDELEGHPINTTGQQYSVGHITKGGKTYTVLRNANGKIRRWVRD